MLTGSKSLDNTIREEILPLFLSPICKLCDKTNSVAGVSHRSEERRVNLSMSLEDFKDLYHVTPVSPFHQRH